jgi:hypothetical protein
MVPQGGEQPRQLRRPSRLLSWSTFRSRIDPGWKTCPSGRHPDPTGGANRELLARIRPSVREIAGTRKRAIIMDIDDLAIRHPNRLPPPLGNRGGCRSDRKSFANLDHRQRPTNFHRPGCFLVIGKPGKQRRHHHQHRQRPPSSIASAGLARRRPGNWRCHGRRHGQNRLWWRRNSLPWGRSRWRWSKENDLLWGQILWNISAVRPGPDPRLRRRRRVRLFSDTRRRSLFELSLRFHRQLALKGAGEWPRT